MTHHTCCLSRSVVSSYWKPYGVFSRLSQVFHVKSTNVHILHTLPQLPRRRKTHMTNIETAARSGKDAVLCYSIRWQLSLMKDKQSLWAAVNVLDRMGPTRLYYCDCCIPLAETALGRGVVFISFELRTRFSLPPSCWGKHTTCLYNTHAFHQQAEQAIASLSSRSLVVVYLFWIAGTVNSRL